MRDSLVRQACGPSFHGTLLSLNASWEADGSAFHGMACDYFSQQQMLWHNGGLGRRTMFIWQPLQFPFEFLLG